MGAGSGPFPFYGLETSMGDVCNPGFAGWCGVFSFYGLETSLGDVCNPGFGNTRLPSPRPPGSLDWVFAIPTVVA